MFVCFGLSLISDKRSHLREQQLGISSYYVFMPGGELQTVPSSSSRSEIVKITILWKGIKKLAFNAIVG